MKRTLMCIGLLAAAVIAAGCDDDGGATTGDGGAGSGGASDAAAGGLDGTGGAAGFRIGRVTLSTTVTTTGPASLGQYNASASFNASAGSSENVWICPIKVIAGGCMVLTCETADAGAGPAQSVDGGVPTSGHVGRIDVAGGADPIVLTPGPDGTYAPVTGDKPLWTSSTELTFKSAGGTIPAFPETKLSSPAVAAMFKLDEADPPAAGTKVTVTRSAGLELSWTGGSGDLEVTVGQTAGGRPVLAVCKGPTPSGRLTMPPEILNELAPGEAVLSLSQTADKTVMAGDYAVTLMASTTPSPARVALDLE